MRRGYVGGLTNIGIRGAGLLLVLIGYLALSILVKRVNASAIHYRSGLIDVACAAIGFLGISIGSALTVLGGHIFDDVRISLRWARRTSSFGLDNEM